MSILDSITSKENFGVWIFVSALWVMIFCVVAVIAIRIYHLKFNKGVENLSVEEAANTLAFHPEMVIQRTLEVIIADTCILGACFVYNLYTQIFSFLSDYNGIVLLVLIIIAIICNNLVDNKLGQDLVNKKVGKSLGKHEADEEIVANLRLMSSIIVLLMLIGFSVFSKTREFSQLIICVVGLVLGRFIYFDTTMQGLWKNIKEIAKNLIYAVIAVLLTMIILGTGIFYKVIDTENFLMSIFGGHIFMLIVINVSKGILDDFIY